MTAHDDAMPSDIPDAEAFGFEVEWHTPKQVREDRDRDDEWGAWLTRGETPLLWGYEGET